MTWSFLTLRGLGPIHLASSGSPTAYTTSTPLFVCPRLRQLSRRGDSEHSVQHHMATLPLSPPRSGAGSTATAWLEQFQHRSSERFRISPAELAQKQLESHSTPLKLGEVPNIGAGIDLKGTPAKIAAFRTEVGAANS